MNVWNFTALALLACMLAFFVKSLGAEPVRRLVPLEAASVTTVLLLLVLCELYHRAIFVDLALTLALLSFGAGLVFARFLERWL